MLLIMCGFRENQLREVCTVLMGVNQIAYRRVPWNRMTLNVWMNFVYFRER